MLENEAPAAQRDLVLLNAGFRVWLAGRAPDVATGIERAREAVESGAARELLERWRTVG